MMDRRDLVNRMQAYATRKNLQPEHPVVTAAIDLERALDGAMRANAIILDMSSIARSVWLAETGEHV